MSLVDGATDDIDSKENRIFGVVQGNRRNPSNPCSRTTVVTTTTVAKRFQVCCLHDYQQVGTGFVFVGNYAINSNALTL